MSEELRPCPFCGENEWQYHAHFSGASVFQCEKCGAIVDECVLNTRPIEYALNARIAELEGELDRRIRMPKDLWFQVAELSTRVNELKAAQRWIPVSERLPEIGVRVLFYNNFIKNIHKGWYSGDEWVSDIGIFYNGDKLKRITHWMPLPKFPEVQE